MLILSFLIGFALRFYPEIHMFLRSPLNLIPIEWAQPDVFNALYIMTIKKISKICIVTSKNISKELKIIKSNSTAITKEFEALSQGLMWYNALNIRCRERFHRSKLNLHELYITHR